MLPLNMQELLLRRQRLLLQWLHPMCVRRVRRWNRRFVALLCTFRVEGVRVICMEGVHVISGRSSGY